MKFLILSTSLIMASALFAEESSDHKRACAADVKKFCPSVEKGQGRIIKCLKEHEKEISPECSARLSKGKERMKTIMENCREDAESLCKDVARGHGAKMKCLDSKKDQVSQKCKEVLP